MEIVRGGVVSKLLEGVPIPKMFRAKQSFPRPLIKREDIPAAVWQAMEGERVASLIKPGMNIAITAGSRGIANVDVITKAIVDFVKKKGLIPLSFLPWEATAGRQQKDSSRSLKATTLRKKAWVALSAPPWKPSFWEQASWENLFT
ncbi:hypothetical protein M5E89_13120 [Acidaminococcus intestini]|nr:hypothetical protein M5E89_13120 [Acidaminococcus intestini]